MYNLNRIGDGKMNKKGFITSALLYGILALFLVLVLGTVSILANRKLANDKIKESALNDVQNLSNDPACFQTQTNSRGNITITGYDSTCDKTVFIPENLNGRMVDAIGPGAFNNQKLVNITMKSNVKEVHVTAFTGNDGMVFYVKAKNEEVVGTGTQEEVNNSVGTIWGAKDATIHWDY